MTLDRNERPVILAIAALVLVYGVSLIAGLPQAGTAVIVGSDSADPGLVQAEKHPHFIPPPTVMVLPFVLLLAAIAILPLWGKASHWWERNVNKLIVAGILALATIAYFLQFHSHPIEGHFLNQGIVEPAESGPSWRLGWVVVQTAILGEYLPFMVLLFSLYTICGGIRIEGDLPAHPATNTLFLAVGALLASFVGTTGAAMLLIRPLIATNAQRTRVVHTIVFFVFIVCNCGGCLLPLGDPPLYLGYLRGVDFLWTLHHLWPEWLVVNCILLAVYYVWDRFFAYPKERPSDLQRDETQVRRLRIAGLWPNLACLAGVVVTLALLDPARPVPGTRWHAWLYLREIVELGLVAVSLTLGSPSVRRANQFNYTAILEVAALFLGIFVCMQPPLQILHAEGGRFGLESPAEFFWCTGALSSILDNAPTYAVFFETASVIDVGAAPREAGVPSNLLAAISLGAVFMGSMTYIGNGPNFMVKSIAESAGIRMPSFFGYVRYSACVLIPIFVVVTWMLSR